MQTFPAVSNIFNIYFFYFSCKHYTIYWQSVSYPKTDRKGVGQKQPQLSVFSKIFISLQNRGARPVLDSKGLSCFN